jgi:lactosylceramide 4-alpha-galactosyltransferase
MKSLKSKVVVFLIYLQFGILLFILFNKHTYFNEDLTDIIHCEPLKSSSNNIFFIESSQADSQAEESLANIDSRFTCSVESAAIKNPNSNVYLIFVNKKQLADSKQIRTLKKFDNVKFLRLDMKSFLENTPVQKWVEESGKFQNASFMANQVSNLLRLMLLAR